MEKERADKLFIDYREPMRLKEMLADSRQGAEGQSSGAEKFAGGEV